MCDLGLWAFPYLCGGRLPLIRRPAVVCSSAKHALMPLVCMILRTIRRGVDIGSGKVSSQASQGISQDSGRILGSDSSQTHWRVLWG
jgi:hypothetical protein